MFLEEPDLLGDLDNVLAVDFRLSIVQHYRYEHYASLTGNIGQVALSQEQTVIECVVVITAVEMMLLLCGEHLGLVQFMLHVFVNDVHVETVITVLSLNNNAGWEFTHHVEFVILVDLVRKGSFD